MVALGEWGTKACEAMAQGTSFQSPLGDGRSSLLECLERRRSLDFIFVYEEELVILLSSCPEL